MSLLLLYSFIFMQTKCMYDQIFLLFHKNSSKNLSNKQLPNIYNSVQRTLKVGFIYLQNYCKNLLKDSYFLLNISKLNKVHDTDLTHLRLGIYMFL